MSSFQFKKEERLKSKKIISRLFDRSMARSFSVYPIRLIWLPTTPSDPRYPVLFALSVPKRHFPKAHQRNRIRRQIREAYRLNKHQLYTALAAGEEHYAFMFLYTAKEALPYGRIEDSIHKIMSKFLTQRL